MVYSSHGRVDRRDSEAWAPEPDETLAEAGLLTEHAATAEGRPFYDGLAEHGDRMALIHGTRSVTYRELDRLSDRRAEEIGADRQLVFLEAANTIDAIAAYLACLKGGHPVYLYSTEDKAQARALRSLYGANVELALDDDGAIGLVRHEDRAIDLHPDLRVLLSTSGSTGSPKFVKLSERNVDSNARSIADYLALTPADRAATALKFNYSYGMSVLNSHLAVGGSLWLTGHSVTSAAFWKGLGEQKCTSFAGVPYTFEVLATSGGDWALIPSLRYVTQAGGKLAPDMVAALAQTGARHGWEFYVMYGQTEAAPRIAYLPPRLASRFPDCIGQAIPGGTLALHDAAGAPITGENVEGELVYQGPNVMLGYAEAAADLATDETPALLYTGDIAIRNEAGLFKILGRTSRFVKPFGRRVNLDDVQAAAREHVPGAACTGDDATIVIAVPDGSASQDDAGKLLHVLADRFQLPPATFEVITLAEIPRLETGKTDYQAILAASRTAPPEPPAIGGNRSIGGIIRALASPLLIKEIVIEALTIAGLRRPEWNSVEEIFLATFPTKSVRPDSTFLSLAGDSLTYVKCAITLEHCIGYLPEAWPERTVAELEGMRADAITF